MHKITLIITKETNNRKTEYTEREHTNEICLERVMGGEKTDGSTMETLAMKVVLGRTTSHNT